MLYHLGPIELTRRRIVEGALLLFFWGAVALLILGREALSPHLGEAGLREGEALHVILEISVWALATPFIFWLASRISPDRLGWIKATPFIFISGVVVAVLIDLLDHFFWNLVVTSAPPRSLSIWLVLDNFHFLTEFFIFMAVLIAGFARLYFLRVEEHRKEAMQLRMDAARLQTNLAEARLNALRMQINPHFLFNTLHIISDHFEENPRAARRMIARLSDILRYSFEGTETREVPLAREMEFLDGYLDIQRFRFEEHLKVNIDIEPDVQDALLPTLILQPIVENAIIHGISQLEGQGTIDIRSWRENEALHIRIADNGPGHTAHNGNGASTGGIGLQNTKERLAMLYGDSQQFIIESPPAGGFVVHIILPYHTGSDYFISSVEV